MNMGKNHYSVSDIIEYQCRKGPDGVYYPVMFAVIGQRRMINGQPVDRTGAPKKD